MNSNEHDSAEELKVKIRNSIVILQTIFTTLAGRSQTACLIPRDCYSLWEEKSKLHTELTSTLPLFEVRDGGWKFIEEIRKAALASPGANPGRINGGNTPFPSQIKFHEMILSFPEMRQLSLSAYISACWSIYDRLANVCGRLASASKFPDESNCNPKIVDFLNKESRDSLGIEMKRYLSSAYRVPIMISYKIRNWVLHDGGEKTMNIPFFSDEFRVESDLFLCHDQAIGEIGKRCGSDKGEQWIKQCCSGEIGKSWLTKDILKILRECEKENDRMFSELLEWCVESFKSHFSIFAKRDKGAFRLSANDVRVS